MEILYIILGWLLGILSPLIVTRVSEQYQKHGLKKIIINDLLELKKRLSPIPFNVYPKYGKMTVEIFEWVEKNATTIDFTERIQKIKEDGDSLEDLVSYMNLNGINNDKSSYFKKMHLFAIDSHLMNFSLINNSFIEKILEVKFHVEALNEDIDSFRDHLKMTFQPLISTENHGIISQEIENKSLWIAKQSMYIVDKINIALKDT